MNDHQAILERHDLAIEWQESIDAARQVLLDYPGQPLVRVPFPGECLSREQVAALMPLLAAFAAGKTIQRWSANTTRDTDRGGMWLDIAFFDPASQPDELRIAP